MNCGFRPPVQVQTLALPLGPGLRAGVFGGLGGGF